VRINVYRTRYDFLTYEPTTRIKRRHLIKAISPSIIKVCMNSRLLSSELKEKLYSSCLMGNYSVVCKRDPHLTICLHVVSDVFTGVARPLYWLSLSPFTSVCNYGWNRATGAWRRDNCSSRDNIYILKRKPSHRTFQSTDSASVSYSRGLLSFTTIPRYCSLIVSPSEAFRPYELLLLSVGLNKPQMIKILPAS
jgi:hypothetical protein